MLLAGERVSSEKALAKTPKVGKGTSHTQCVFRSGGNSAERSVSFQKGARKKKGSRGQPFKKKSPFLWEKRARQDRGKGGEKKTLTRPRFSEGKQSRQKRGKKKKENSFFGCGAAWGASVSKNEAGLDARWKKKRARP